MKVSRGEIVLAEMPFASGGQSKLRPALVVQADYYNQRLHNVILALITSNLRNASDRAHLLIEVSTSEGQLSGLTQDSVVSCVNVVTLFGDRIRRKIGKLSQVSMDQVSDCLRAALEIA